MFCGSTGLIYSPARRVFRGSSSLQAGDVVDIFFCKKNLDRLLQPAADGGVDIIFCKRNLQRLLQLQQVAGLIYILLKEESSESPPACRRCCGILLH
jgi:hypothetical protein